MFHGNICFMVGTYYAPDTYYHLYVLLSAFTLQRVSQGVAGVEHGDMSLEQCPTLVGWKTTHLSSSSSQSSPTVGIGNSINTGW